MIESGSRDKLVTIQQRPASDAGGTTGFPVDSWTDLGTEWMSKRDVSGSERMAGAQMSAVIDSEFELPYRADMDPDLLDVPKTRRLRYAGRVYDIVRPIKAPREDGENIRLITTTQTQTEALE